MANITNEERERRQREEAAASRETSATVRRDPGPDVSLGQDSQAGGGDPQKQLKEARQASQKQTEETSQRVAEMKATPTQEELDEIRLRNVGGLAYQTREAKPNK
jgi:hypothetical protein